MKTRILFERFSFLIPLTFILLFGTCNKDDDPSKSDYRVVQWNYMSGETIAGSVYFNYEGNKINLITTKDPSSDFDSTKTEVQYPDVNSAVLKEYYYLEGLWNEYYKQELTFQNENVTQSIDYEFIEGAYNPYSKISYQYDGNNLIEEIYASYFEGAWEENMKSTYEYNGSKMISSKLYLFDSGSWQELMKAEISYADGKIDERTEYLYADGVYNEDYKYVFNYYNNHLSAIDGFLYEDSTWVSDGEFASFTYTTFDRVATWTNVLEDHSKVHFLYEKGKGNINQIYFQGEEYFDYMLPVPTKSGQRTGIKRFHPKNLPFISSL